MPPLPLHDRHAKSDAEFISLNGQEAVNHYGNPDSEYRALRETVAVIDLSFRSRLCLIGADRTRFLHGQVTNDVQRLRPGEGCYAALITAKGKMLSDLVVYILNEEILLDFEPGLGPGVIQRLEKYIVADDVQIVDVSTDYSLLGTRGPLSPQAVADAVSLPLENLPAKPFDSAALASADLGELYIMNQPGPAPNGFDLFVPRDHTERLFDRLLSTARSHGGSLAGWQSLETARIEAGLPRFGIDMDETNLPPEAGLEQRAISYTKGCYIGQEVISRIRAYGQVAKSLRGLLLPPELQPLPKKGDRLCKGDREVGYVTSSVASPALRANIALGYVRRECNQAGTELTLHTDGRHIPVRIIDLPFLPATSPEKS